MDIFSDLHHLSDIGLLALRIATGVIFIVHGVMKFRMWQPNPPMQGGMLQLMRFLAVVEPIMGVALIVGFLTQISALGGILIMIGALYLKMAVWKMPFRADDKTGWEFDLMILAGCLMLLFAGAGEWSVDYALMIGR